jgi:hypothetical protein
MAMSAEHKAALAAGRRESRAIKEYLGATAARRPGRPVTAETLTARIADLEKRIAAEMNPLKAVDLRQARLDAEQALDAAKDTADTAALEAAFIEHAKAYSERKGITYAAWRESGVPAAVLKKAGITRAG